MPPVDRLQRAASAFQTESALEVIVHGPGLTEASFSMTPAKYQIGRKRGAATRYHRIVASLVYLDICCLKRPFDDQRSARVQVETAAVADLIARAERGEIRLVRSPAHTFENDHNPREDRRLATQSWLNGAGVTVDLTDDITARAHELKDHGFTPLDALHAAFAEAAGAVWLATTDDRMLSLAQRPATRLRVRIANPTDVLEAITKREP